MSHSNDNKHLNKTNDDNNLNEMLKAASENADNFSENKSKNKSKKKAIWITLGSMTAFGVLLFAGALMLRPQEFEDKTESPTWVSEQKDREEQAEKISMWNFEYPVDVPEWTKQPFSLESIVEDEKTLAKAHEFAESIQAIQSSLSWMPSGELLNDEEGYTNDIAEEFIGDNIPNPDYSYTLREDYLTAYSTYIQRLINPTFGDWIFAQRYIPAQPMKDNNTYRVLSDMFSDEWWDNNIEENYDYSALPLLADWEGDNFGGLEFAQENSRYGTFFGVVNETEDDYVTIESLGVDERESEILKIDTPVKFVAFGTQGPIEKHGTVSITLASNNEPISQNRVVITHSELILK